MTREKWLLEQIDDLRKNTADYERDAFLIGLKEIVKEQYKRMEQAEGELDGTLWSPKQW